MTGHKLPTIIRFVTGNAGKVATMAEHLKDFDIEIRQTPLTLIEPQASTVEEVALSKARQAFGQLKAPVVVEDSAFCIDELNGFPGPYIKYALETIGIEGLLRLASNLRSRQCRFVSALVYIDAGGKSTVFTEKGASGRLSMVPAPENSVEAWSELWRIFSPYGAKNPLSALTSEEQKVIWEAWAKQSKFAEFGAWLKIQEHA